MAKQISILVRSGVLLKSMPCFCHTIYRCVYFGFQSLSPSHHVTSYFFIGASDCYELSQSAGNNKVAAVGKLWHIVLCVLL